ncbi:MAG TPA: MerR family transcriptional regulator [Candidatus Brachybacterium merdavium]|uniref:MerR family transcriptional regulator n=1 Tax=Candidatus Brachybacterium merdavium TaxID=2838513 RepID=A0A9D2RPQ7_9MICO|nr:MerR family transcriptional regulator [Candidatus Brachybacterium merdavium]
MRIGELSRRTGVTPRLLRYYEQQDLIAPQRSGNGYRTYTEEDVARVEQVAQMVRSGLPTRLVRAILDLEGVDSAELAATCSRSVALQLASALEEIEGRISCLTRSRDSIDDFLRRTERGGLVRSEVDAGRA